MKKILTIVSIVPILAFSGIDVKKVTNTLAQIKSNKQLSFFNADRHILLDAKIKLTTLNGADIVLFSSKEHKSKMTMVDSYKKLKLNKNSIGAIYLKKGRTQIIFVKERLDSHGLVLSSRFKKHIMHEWQLESKGLINNLK